MSKRKLLLPRRPSQTKIVATVGPACAQTEQLADLIRTGVDVFRLNTAHGSHAEHQQRLEQIREASRQTGQVVAVLVDLAGPKIRLGKLPEDRLEVRGGGPRSVCPGATGRRPVGQRWADNDLRPLDR
ncbi:MAG: hypothetical protein GXP27_08890 [Planctomycetes bacterium]|nr:hypothetical protein [Planctomycetota bacterium]